MSTFGETNLVCLQPGSLEGLKEPMQEPLWGSALEQLYRKGHTELATRHGVLIS
jgi:hypothetical protein